jgi:hypothetical protein
VIDQLVINAGGVSLFHVVGVHGYAGDIINAPRPSEKRNGAFGVNMTECWFGSSSSAMLRH